MLRKAASLFCFVLTTNRQYDKLNKNYGVEGEEESSGLCCGYAAGRYIFKTEVSTKWIRQNID